ncbi:MAG TPA: UDP-3-O-(3-hydroxymyristoyl)glucosamine N-acyltransferase, partial [Usitatibacter sp.]|nr:UDP-3-O-(3-hydroxymyristoyl)glucosamine N-acyltransferase [Usitatibacter sp.]
HPEPPVAAGVHPSADVHPAAMVDASAQVEAFVSIGAGTRVAAGVRIGSGCAVGANVTIGAGTRLHPRVTIYDGCTLGARCIVHSGAVIGADGFGMARDSGRWVKIPQVGAVRIGDDVEIGANTTIDRGALDDTVVEDGVKLDNLIQIAHNCVIGAHTVIAGCTGISGSTTVGRHCMIGGGVGIVGHISICDNVVISGFSLVAKSILKPGTYTSGMPLMPHDEWLRNAAHLRRLDRIARGARGKKAGEDDE